MSLKYKCEFCEKIISKNSVMLHYTKSHHSEFVSKNELILHVLKLKNNTLSDNLIKLIIKDYKKISILALIEKYGFNYRTFQLLFEAKNIKIKGISETNSQQSVRDKFKQTCIENFGVENVSKSQEIKNKKANTFIEHYGVDNIFKDEKFKSTLNDILFEKYGTKRVFNYEKTKENNLEKYGFEHVFQIPSVIELTKKTNLERYGCEYTGSCNELIEKSKNTKNAWSDERYNLFIERLTNSQKERWKNMSDEDRYNQLYRLHHTYISAIELRIAYLLNILDIKYQSTYFLTNKSYDLYIEEFNLIIEINGDFWHANPNKYKAHDILKFPKKVKTASEIWEKDRIKKELAENLGYNTFYIWENEINKSTDDKLIEILLQEFEKCKLKKLNQ
jgi:G:T-mismatch repair DNA endonuclease (very short patch repair protein)